VVLLFYFYFSLLLWHAPGARRAAPRGWWPCYFISFYFLLFWFILVYFHNTHQVLIGLPQGVGGLAILFLFIFVYFYHPHQVLVGLSQGVGGLAILFLF